MLNRPGLATYVIGVLAAQVAGMLGFYFSVGLFFFACPLHCPQLVFGQDQTVLRYLG